MTAAKAQELGIRDCVNVSSDIGPFLIINGEAQDVDGVGGGLNPRTAIGQRADGAIILLVVDGRQVTSLGASFSDLQDIMLQYGAVMHLLWMEEHQHRCIIMVRLSISHIHQQVQEHFQQRF